MSQVLVHIHGLLPYLFLPLMLVTLVMTGSALSSGNLSKRGISLARVVMILAHVQFLFGILLLAFGEKAKLLANGMGPVMQNASARLSLVEHPTMMLIGIVLITVGFVRSKKTEDGKTKAKRIFIPYAIGLILILSRIPYTEWFS